MIKLRSISRFDYLGMDSSSLVKQLNQRLHYTVGQAPDKANNRSWYQSLTYVIRDKLLDRWYHCANEYNKKGTRRVYYLSLEFLLGRLLQNALINLDCEKEIRHALLKLGLDLEQIRDCEPDAALGNGGLGRLAACFLDSMATLGIPGFGYGIRYEYGMFKQRIEKGYQIEHPDSWLRYGNPWEIPKPDLIYHVRFFGHVTDHKDHNGRVHQEWCDTQDVMAMAYDMFIPGFANNHITRLRLWSAKSSRDFDLQYFNEGNYIKAMQDKTASENLSRVLYPDDSTEVGRVLRLQQEYFFVSAALQDILRKHNEVYNDLSQLAEYVAIQLNDTHPAIAVPELMRLLIDEQQFEWDAAWDICTSTFSYTNHTLMPESLESWPVALIDRLLPRHMQIIYEINKRLMEQVRRDFPNDHDKPRRVSLIDESGERKVRMANLAVAGSHKVNGVSQLHSELLQTTLFSDFNQIFPDKFISLTNGINPRRWLRLINPDLAKLISKTIGSDWIKNLDSLRNLVDFSQNKRFHQKYSEVKLNNKKRLAHIIESRIGIAIDSNSMFDVHIKRIHEYKRQLLKMLHVITLYNKLCDKPQSEIVARTVIISGKAAPGYMLAKQIIKLINDVADIINNNPATNHKLKILYIPNYDVSTAGDIIPATDLSEQISLAGTEASGTGNMKLALNGALTIGTLDGANIEMRDHIGADNIFIFGLTAEQAKKNNDGKYKPREYLRSNEDLSRAIDMIEEGYFSPDNRKRHYPIVDALTRSDPYMVLADFAAYAQAQNDVETCYKNKFEWTRKSILNIAGMGYFSSDRTIREYAQKVWKIKT
ncbi:Glycogen phosphorylase [hydrothermal vent metagenome]|uniref:glycogen phosphorylase n=1 Tax=hydrothermal vent metagenome TaxID=652676 RepID=A0A3B0Z5Q4_9ZZZZ